ncbi:MULTISPECIES: enhanced serine sensitivity protein SseB [unclassified Streptomyces]|uniref:enhanced serine sensitivity protein SseB n=1 Tax=unclassified Streptomyces TaxID=2593676 RepID=UPI001F043C01|nr:MULTISPECIES: enhanced serine sensitivity protein SseB [unclassified Streptomyces]MCH0565863.1 enhanced serine sensitivity protein SseB [Streptomyces sp. MUM 2J]MCH0571390.1 enhanced serine sensitivity protein SseB [Streptomyces sp. MUM 136J]
MDFPADLPGGFPAPAHPHPHGGWPGNELEEVLSASLGVPEAGGRIIEVLCRSFLWVPLPGGGGPDSGALDLPGTEIDGQAYVPVFSSEEQFRQVAGAHMAYAVAPAVEFARGLPPQVGIAVNPGGVVGAPLPPRAVAELCRAGLTPLDGPGDGGRVRLFEPDWQDDPVDFLSAAAAEFEATGVVLTARRCLAAIETADPVVFVGVELSRWEEEVRAAPLDALGRALGRVPVRWPVNLILMDVAQDPVADWMREQVRPFYQRGL